MRYEMWDATSGNWIGDYAGHDEAKARADLEAIVRREPELLEMVALLPIEDDGSARPAIFATGAKGLPER